MAARVQIVWKWKPRHAPDDKPIRWQFAAHGAAYDRGNAEEHAALLRSHGKLVRFLPL